MAYERPKEMKLRHKCGHDHTHDVTRYHRLNQQEWGAKILYLRMKVTRTPCARCLGGKEMKHAATSNSRKKTVRKGNGNG